MLNKNIDALIVGKSFYSLLLGIELIGKGKKVLLVDDKRFAYGDRLNRTIFQLEVDLLKHWGKKANIEPFAQIERYLTRKPVQFITTKKRVFLGGDPVNNFSEVARKLLRFDERNKNGLLEYYVTSFVKEKFNNNYMDYCEELAKRLFSETTLKNLSSDTFHGFNEEIDKIFTLFKEIFFDLEKNNDDGNKDLYSFIYMSEGHFHKKFGVKDGPLNFKHLVLSFLSPQYDIDNQKLTRDLLETYKIPGGEFKETDIKEWFYDKGKPWAVELDSFDGIVYPKRTYFFTEGSVGLPIEILPKYKRYHAVEVKKRYDSTTKREIKDQIIFSSFEKIGTDIPLVEVAFMDGIANFKLFIERTIGDKVEFYEEKIMKTIDQITKYITDCKMDRLPIEGPKFSNDICIKDDYGLVEVAKDYFGDDITIFNRVTPLKSEKLNNVRYIGPIVRKPHGMLSILMDVMDELY